MVETNRFMLRPLTYHQLVKYLKADNSLEKELNLNDSPRTISTALREALEQTFLPNAADTRKNYLFSTLWTVIDKEKNRMVGDLCVVSEPDKNGEIEIGYGTYLAFQGRGIMSEALAGFIQWAADQPGVLALIARTNKDNPASSRVLEKNNFLKVGQSDSTFAWKLTLDPGAAEA